MDIISELQNWYKANCNENWEHSYGVTIDTLDNPGWSVKIDLNDTKLAGKKFESVVIDNSEDDWIHCKVEESKFVGHADSQKLNNILQIFLEWSKV